MSKSDKQQEFLRQAMKSLGLKRKDFCKRVDVKKRALDNWVLPSDSKGFRKMPDSVKKFIKEILHAAK